MTIAINIRKLRNDLNMTQSELAEKANLSLRGIQAIETEERMPRVETLQKIADAFGVPVSDLYLSGDGNPSPLTVTPHSPDRASLILEIQDMIRELSQDDLETLKFTASSLLSNKTARKNSTKS